MKLQNKTVSRSYIISSKELKKAFNIKGVIQEIGSWEGLKQSQGEPNDKDEWEIVTHEEEGEELLK